MATRNNRDGAYRMALCALLLALMLILGYVESLIPLNAGIPGIKLGLSNGVLIFAVYMLDVPTGFMLMALKVLLSGMLFGSPSMMMYGFAGGVLSLGVMSLLRCLKRLPVAVVSLAGGVAHNAGQVCLAMAITATPALAWYLLVLSVVGAGCGILTGVCADAVMKHLRSAGVIRRIQKKKSGKRAMALALALVAATGILCGALLIRQQSVENVEWDTGDRHEVQLPLPNR